MTKEIKLDTSVRTNQIGLSFYLADSPQEPNLQCDGCVLADYLPLSAYWVYSKIHHLNFRQEIIKTGFQDRLNTLINQARPQQQLLPFTSISDLLENFLPPINEGYIDRSANFVGHQVQERSSNASSNSSSDSHHDPLLITQENLMNYIAQNYPKTNFNTAGTEVHHSFFAGATISDYNDQRNAIFVAMDIGNSELLDPLKLSIVDTSDAQTLIHYLLNEIMIKKYGSLDNLGLNFRLFHRSDEKAPPLKKNKIDQPKPLKGNIKVK
jgi:hypothetical protein